MCTPRRGSASRYSLRTVASREIGQASIDRCAAELRAYSRNSRLRVVKTAQVSGELGGSPLDHFGQRVSQRIPVQLWHKPVVQKVGLVACYCMRWPKS